MSDKLAAIVREDEEKARAAGREPGEASRGDAAGRSRERAEER